MARFVSRYAKYRHGIRNGREMVLADGQRQTLVSELIAVFDRGVLSPEEVDFGIEKLNHTGLPIDRDTEQLYSPRHRISGFDSVLAQQQNGWTDEERETVEQVLRDSPNNGRDFLELDVATPGKPWPTYDTTDVRKIVGVAVATGTSLADILAYEKATRNDPSAVLLIEDAINTPTSDVEEDKPVVIEA